MPYTRTLEGFYRREPAISIERGRDGWYVYQQNDFIGAEPTLAEAKALADDWFPDEH